MADQQIGNVRGFASRSVNGGTNPTNVNGGGSNGNQKSVINASLVLQDIDTMRTRLAAISAGYYTTSRLNQMTVNDMVYAIRVNDFAGGI